MDESVVFARIQDDQKVSVRLMITVQKSPQNTVEPLITDTLINGHLQ
jgi:hypothetical protein